MIAARINAAGFLLSAGFLIGLCLSTGTTRWALPRASSTERAGGGGGEGGGMPGQSGGGGGQRGAMAEREGKQRAGGGGGGGGDGKSARAGQESDGSDGGDAKAPAAKESASDAPGRPATTDLLTGNTLRSNDGRGGVIVRYLSRHGWQAVQERRDMLLVHRWTARNGHLCVVLESAAVCETIAIALDAQPDSATGAVLGSVTMEDGQRWTLLRGNAAGMPDVIPLIGGDKPSRHEGADRAATVIGEPAVKAFVGRTMIATNGQAATVGSRYETDGRWIVAEPLLPADKTGTGGVRVSIGHWLFAGDTLCLDQPGLDLNRSCYRPEQWGPATLRLVSDKTAAVTTLIGADANL